MDKLTEPFRSATVPVADNVQKKSKSLYSRFKLKYCVPFLILISYTVFGAIIFYFCERKHDLEKRKHFTAAHDYARRQLLGRLFEIKIDPEITTSTLTEMRVEQALKWFLDELNLTEVISTRIGESPWNFNGCMFYAGTLYTTIGYGNPAAVTSIGMVLTCFYTIAGIPLFLVILKEIGKHLSHLLCKVYERFNESRSLRDILRQYRLTKARLSISHLEMGHKRTTSTEETPKARHNAFPVSWALLLLIFWIVFSGALFSLWENEWSFFSSVYFFFISISTVGLGDLVPKHQGMMIINFILILIGLSLLSMCVDLVQRWIEQMLQEMLQQFVAEFEKMAQIMTVNDEQPVEIGMSNALVSAPFITHLEESEASGTMRAAKGWLTRHLVQISSKRSESDSDDDEDEAHQKASATFQNPVSQKAFEAATKKFGQKSGLSKDLLTKLFDKDKLQNVENQIRHKIMQPVATQTDNDFTYLMGFLSLPKALQMPTEMVDSALTSDSQVVSDQAYLSGTGSLLDLHELDERPVSRRSSSSSSLSSWAHSSPFASHLFSSLCPTSASKSSLSAHSVHSTPALHLNDFLSKRLEWDRNVKGSAPHLNILDESLNYSKWQIDHKLLIPRIDALGPRRSRSVSVVRGNNMNYARGQHKDSDPHLLTNHIPHKHGNSIVFDDSNYVTYH